MKAGALPVAARAVRGTGARAAGAGGGGGGEGARGAQGAGDARAGAHDAQVRPELGARQGEPEAGRGVRTKYLLVGASPGFRLRG